jgi:hypothetical protein
MSHWTENPLKPKTAQEYANDIGRFFNNYIDKGEGSLDNLRSLLNVWAQKTQNTNKTAYLYKHITDQKKVFDNSNPGKQAEYNTRAQTLKDLVNGLGLSGGRRRSNRRTRRSRSSRKSLRVNKKTRRR